MLIQAIRNSLLQLQQLLSQLTDADFTRPCPALDDATIGQHTRHIIEMYQCLENQYESGRVCYDSRPRDESIQSTISVAIQKLSELQDIIGRPDKTLQLQQALEGCELQLESNYERELLYNLEHCIHHQALIKVALMYCPTVRVGEDFGVAAATVAYRKQCAP